MIAAIDRYAIDTLGISEETLIRRAGEAIADAILEYGIKENASVLIFCGGGNNGADGYAAALSLGARGFHPAAVDVFGRRQRSEGGRAVLAAYTEAFGAPCRPEVLSDLPTADVLVDAMFGTGFSGELPEKGCAVARYMNGTDALRVAVDLPFGVDAAEGGICEEALRADLTVVLSFMKKGLLSYPARECCGSLVLKDIGLDIDSVHAAFPALEDAVDDDYVRARLPRRRANSHKGSYGKALLIAGSSRYRGAAHLATHAALRCGVGLLSLMSEECVAVSVGKKLPEAIYRVMPPMAAWGDAELQEAIAACEGMDAILIGSGSGKSEMLRRLVLALLARDGAPLILDADAINVLAERREAALSALANAKRSVLLTPHPLEFSRLSGIPMAEVQASRMRCARTFAEQTGAAVLLKGAGTVIASRDGVSVNTSGSSALAKGGSGDVLAGIVTAFTAQGANAHEALAMAAYLHGKAGESLAEELSEYGVLVSDLPRQTAVEIRKILK